MTQILLQQPIYFMGDDCSMIELFYYREDLSNNCMRFCYKDCNDNLYGDVTGYHRNGQMSFSLSYVKNIPHGVFESFYPNGQPYIKCRFNNNKISGTLYQYSENGLLLFKEEYKDDQLDGIMNVWVYNEDHLRTDNHNDINHNDIIRKDLLFENNVLKREERYKGNILLSAYDYTKEESDKLGFDKYQVHRLFPYLKYVYL